MLTAKFGDTRGKEMNINMKRVFTIIVFGLLLSPVYAQLEKFSENDKVGLKYKEQVVLLPKYEDINIGYILSKGNNYSKTIYVYDFDGDSRFGVTGDYSDRSFCFKQNGYWGVMRFEEILIEPKYEKAVIFKIEHDTRLISNYELVRVKLKDKYGLITLGGQEILPLKYDEILLGFTLWNPEIKEDILCFVTKRNGKLSITTLYEQDLPIAFSIDDFKDKGNFKKLRKTLLKEITQLYSVNNEEFSKRADKWISLCRTKKPKQQKKQIICIGDSTYICEAIKYSGWDPKKSGGAVYKINGKYGLCDKRRIITEPIYDEAVYGDYWHVISKNGKYGLVNSDGKETIALMYDKLSEVSYCKCIFVAINNDTVNIVSPNNNIILSNIKWDNKKTVFENLSKNKKKIKKACELWYNTSEGKRVRYQSESYGLLLYNSTVYWPFLGIEEKINIKGFEGKIYETGFIDIPFIYDYPDQIYARDPNNFYGKSLSVSYEPSQNIEISEDENEEFNQKMDRIANIGTSIINSITTAISNPGNEQYASFGLSDETAGGSGNYQAMYEKWERRAEKHYKSMTKSGRSKESKQEASGSTGSKMSGGNFVAQKRSFREAQKEMKKIREKARKAGVIIEQSKWETATIDY